MDLPIVVSRLDLFEFISGAGAKMKRHAIVAFTMACLFPLKGDYAGLTFSAAGPFAPLTTSKLTDWPSVKVLNPLA